MRQPQPTLLRLIVLSLALLFVSSTAFADARTEARTHYQAGVKFYNAQDYRSAIREFSAAQQLMPADLNNYNLALCYDKLGDAEPAIQYYRAFLDKQPNSDKRAEIDASISRLDTAAKSAAAKKAEEARRADETRRAEEARIAAEEAKKAEAARKAEEARKAAEAAKRPGPDELPEPPGTEPVAGGSIGTPSSGTAVSTGDAQLDRVQSINIDQVRDERAGSGMVTTPPPAPNNANAMPPTAPPAGRNAGMPANAAGTQPMGPQDQPKKADPVYKKWWFWAIVVVGAYVVYQIATEDSPSNVSRTLLPEGPAAQPNQGTVLWRF
ncbi:MAG: tetratricopeptide repeat protein [Kofleriaceae bacterium]